MERESRVIAISKVAVAGEQAGFSLEQMIQLLDSGLTVKRASSSSSRGASNIQGRCLFPRVGPCRQSFRTAMTLADAQAASPPSSESRIAASSLACEHPTTPPAVLP
jgi:hypothetical protein